MGGNNLLIVQVFLMHLFRQPQEPVGSPTGLPEVKDLHGELPPLCFLPLHLWESNAGAAQAVVSFVWALSSSSDVAGAG